MFWASLTAYAIAAAPIDIVLRNPVHASIDTGCAVLFWRRWRNAREGDWEFPTPIHASVCMLFAVVWYGLIALGIR